MVVELDCLIRKPIQYVYGIKLPSRDGALTVVLALAGLDYDHAISVMIGHVAVRRRLALDPLSTRRLPYVQQASP